MQSLRCAAIVVGLAVASATSGCASCSGTGQRALGIIEGPINDPGNRSLRRAILSFGLNAFCHQMTTRDVPLKLAEDSPVIGRFYPTQCAERELDNGDVFVNFSGFGYAYTNVSKKTAFTSAGSVQYDQDFLMDGSTMYAYFRTKKLDASDFHTTVIEQPIANVVNQLSPIADMFGKQLLVSKLGEGFTVIREADGTADFGLGVIEKGQRPPHPYDVHGSGRLTWENQRTEVHQNERDFLGPVEIEDDGRALYLTANVDGGIPIDVLLLSKSDGESSLKLFTSYPMIGPLAGSPSLSDVAQPGVEYRRTLPVPRGQYWVVLDNSASAGQVAPPNNPLDDRAVTVNYVVQIGDAP